jgi:hypothetical protein
LVGFVFEFIELRQQPVLNQYIGLDMEMNSQKFQRSKVCRNVLYTIGTPAMTGAAIALRAQFQNTNDTLQYAGKILYACSYLLVSAGAIVDFLQAFVEKVRTNNIIVFVLIGLGCAIAPGVRSISLFTQVDEWIGAVGGGLLAGGFGLNSIMTIVS